MMPTDRTADEYARLKEALAKAGALIPENDLWIAAYALEHGLPLITRDAHFARVPGLTVLAGASSLGSTSARNAA